jgi:hypothetical protein
MGKKERTKRQQCLPSQNNVSKNIPTTLEASIGI